MVITLTTQAREQYLNRGGRVLFRVQREPSLTTEQFSELLRELAEREWGHGCTYTYMQGSDHDGVEVRLESLHPDMVRYLNDPTSDPPTYNCSGKIQASQFTERDFEAACKLLGALFIRDCRHATDELEWLHHQACEVYGPTDELVGNLAYLTLERWMSDALVKYNAQ